MEWEGELSEAVRWGVCEVVKREESVLKIPLPQLVGEMEEGVLGEVVWPGGEDEKRKELAVNDGPLLEMVDAEYGELWEEEEEGEVEEDENWQRQVDVGDLIEGQQILEALHSDEVPISQSGGLVQTCFSLSHRQRFPCPYHLEQ